VAESAVAARVVDGPGAVVEVVEVEKSQQHGSDDDRDGTSVAPLPLLGALEVGHARLAIGVLTGSLVGWHGRTS
jgi:hypothetical protein